MTNPRKKVVLFLCTGNSARSQMAQALLQHLDTAGRFEAHSAGLHPKEQVHPLAVQVLKELGLDAAGLYPKPSSQYLGKVAVNYAIIVCSKAQSECPTVYPFAANTLYWPFDDPAEAQGSEAERLQAFGEARGLIRQRISTWLKSELES